MSIFQTIKDYLWLIYIIRFAFIAYTFILSLEKSNFLNFLSPQELLVKAKSTQILDS